MKDKKGWIGFSYAFNGIKTVILTERNFQIHLVCMFLVLGIGFLLNINRYEWLILLLVISLVLITEMINSAIERLIDYLKPEIHPEAKLIKDIAAGAVLVSAIFAVIIGIIIFLPYLWR